MNKKVSVVVPYFNGNLNFLQKTLSSIQDQTYSDLEVLLIDDHSELEHYENVKNKIAEMRDDRFSIIRMDKNFGPCEVRIHASKLSSGKYIAFCDADDLWYKNKVFEQVNYLKSNDKDALASNMDIIDEKDKFIGIRGCNDIEIFDLDNKSFFSSLLLHNPIITSSVLMKKSIFLRSLPHQLKGKEICEDWSMWLGLAFVGAQFGYIDSSLGAYRKHSQNNSLSWNLNKNYNFKHIFFYLDKLKKSRTFKNNDYRRIEKNVLHLRYQNYAAHLYKSNNKRTARKYIYKSLSCKFNFKSLRRLFKYFF